MAKALGYRFTDEQWKRGIYYPTGHGEREVARLAILHNLNRLLGGETAINMRVKEMPVTPEAAAAQMAILEKLAKTYTDEGTLKITVTNEQNNK